MSRSDKIRIGVMAVVVLAFGGYIGGKVDFEGGPEYMKNADFFMGMLERVSPEYPEVFVSKDIQGFAEIKEAIDRIRPDLKDKPVRGITHTRNQFFYALEDGGYVVISGTTMLEEAVESSIVSHWWKK